MQALNNFFKELAIKLSLPDFFQNTGLLFNNLFLAVVAAVSLIALILVVCLFRTKKKGSDAKSVD